MNIFEAKTTEDCELLLSNISQINLVNEAGDTPLLTAVQKRELKAVKGLLENGADKEATNKEGKTALQVAVTRRRIDIVTLLLDHGADIKAVNMDGDSSLHLAVLDNHLQMAQLLLSRGANINATNKIGVTPLIRAALCGFEDMVKLLLQHGADHSLGTTEHDNTALIWASNKGYHAIAKTLLDVGADPFHTIQNGTTVLTVASDELMKRMVREYQQPDGPSWLVWELSKRELEWSVVCDTQDKLKKAHITSRESLARIPSAQFTDAYLKDIGIDTLTVRCALLEMRAHATWLGARLASQGESVANMLLWENFVYDVLGCTTEASFAALPASELHVSVLSRLQPSPSVCERLRVVHQQLCAKNRNPSQCAPLATAHNPPVTTVPTPHLPAIWEENRSVRNTVVKVENAGMPEVNGIYTCTSMSCYSSTFFRLGQYKGEMVRFILYSEGGLISNSGLIWNIAMVYCVSLRKVPLYCTVTKATDNVPPVGINWMCVLTTQSSISVAPAPSVIVVTGAQVTPQPAPVSEEPQQSAEGISQSPVAESTLTTPPGPSVTPTTLAMPLALATEVTVTQAVQESDGHALTVSTDSTVDTPSVACSAGPEDASLQESSDHQEPPLPPIAEGPLPRTESTHSDDSKDDGYMLVKEEWMGALY